MSCMMRISAHWGGRYINIHSTELLRLPHLYHNNNNNTNKQERYQHHSAEYGGTSVRDYWELFKYTLEDIYGNNIFHLNSCTR